MLHSFLLSQNLGKTAFAAGTVIASATAAEGAQNSTEAMLIASVTSVVILLIKELVKSLSRRK